MTDEKHAITELWADYADAPSNKKKLVYGIPAKLAKIVNDGGMIQGTSVQDWIVLPLKNSKLELTGLAYISPKQGERPIYAPSGYPLGAIITKQPTKDKPIYLCPDPESGFKIAEAGFCSIITLTPDQWSSPNRVEPTTAQNLAIIAKEWQTAGYTVAIPVACHLVSQYKKWFINNSRVLILPLPLDTASLYKDELIKELRDGIIKAKLIQEWGELEPLEVKPLTVSQAYPIEALPIIAADAARAIAEHVQVPTAMAAQCVIGALSYIAQSQVNAQGRLHSMPCSLYLLTEGASGSRKSGSQRLAEKVISNIEQSNYEVYRNRANAWQTKTAPMNMKEKAEYVANYPEPDDPSTIFTDATIEPITSRFIDGQVKNAMWSTAEAAQFFNGHTMKGDTAGSTLGLLTTLFDDGNVARTRAKSNSNGSGKAYGVRLTFNLLGQREILEKVINDPVLRGQGFLPRFLLAAPESLAGTRIQTLESQARRPSDDPRLKRYWAACKNKLTQTDAPRVLDDNNTESCERSVLNISTHAQPVFLALYNETEQAQAKGGKLEYLTAFASRAEEIARRVATVFAFFDDKQEIDEQTAANACAIVQHSLSEWLRYADAEPATESEAEKLVKWLLRYCHKNKLTELSYTTLMNNCPRPFRGHKIILEPVIQQLIDSNYIKIKELSKVRYVVIRPDILKAH